MLDRISMRRYRPPHEQASARQAIPFTRLTNAFSKSAEAHYHMMALYVVFHNFVRDHKTLRCTPAEAAGLVKSAMTISDIVDLIDARAEPPKPRGSYKPRQPKEVKHPSI